LTTKNSQPYELYQQVVIASKLSQRKRFQVESVDKDALFWPPLDRCKNEFYDIRAYLPNAKNSLINKPKEKTNNYTAVVSLWYHLIEFINENNLRLVRISIHFVVTLWLYLSNIYSKHFILVIYYNMRKIRK
jgi:hypothetical protein